MPHLPEPIRFRIYESPFGRLGLILDAHGRLLRIAFLEETPDLALERHYPSERFCRTEAPGCASETARQLDEYFAGVRRVFDLDLAPVGTAFQRQVWAFLRQIPSGETRTYGEAAAHLGRPRAARAVGRANATNPWPIVVPCHRLVGSDGTLTGFAGGLAFKQALLDLERNR